LVEWRVFLSKPGTFSRCSVRISSNASRSESAADSLMPLSHFSMSESSSSQISWFSVASVEKRDIKDILTELIDDYIERHGETLEILSRPDWVSAINEGLKAAERGETVKWRKKKSKEAVQ
jgi:predicted transcriptional regulator